MLKAAKNEYRKVEKENKQLREYMIANRKKEYKQQKTVIKKQIPQKYKTVVYELESDSEVEETEEGQEKKEQPSQYITEKNPTKQTGEKDAKKNRN